VGKKLNRTAGKTRIETLQNQRKERIAKAGLLLERWGQQERVPVSDEYELSEIDPDFIEDQMTAEVLSSLTAEQMRIVRQHWSAGHSAAEIAEMEEQPRNEIRQILGFVVEQVADKVLK
jgi:DNA-directed RNA polymerase specialized sigma24 family protein